MTKYSRKKIEKKWQKRWDKSGIYNAEDFSRKKKYYCLIEFPYPSGAGLHVGHLRSHIAIDIIARKKRMEGYNVLYPIGWDAFGLPTENYAIKTKTHPKIVTENNIKNFTRQIKSYGPSFDWSREIDTTDPKYYKWTQWIFLKLFNSFYDEKLDKARPIEELKIPNNLSKKEFGSETSRPRSLNNYIDSRRLAYEAEMAINWCPSCKIGLANEEVVSGECERCHAKAEKKIMKQWMLRITKYANRLISDLYTVDYLDKIKAQQINWIGRSEGVIIKFPISNFQFPNKSQISNSKSQINSKFKIQNSNIPLDKGGLGGSFLEVFTTRPDTIFGCTYMVLAPEHSLITNYKLQITNYDEVKKYIKKAKQKSDLDRTDLAKEKTGVELKGVKAINPANNEEIPIWVADYVLASYGTGAIMAVPAHDQRDFEFAKKFGLPIKKVIVPKNLNCVIVHGCPSKKEDDPIKRTYDKHWMPWLKKELSIIGISVETPLMPEPWRPNYDAWKKEFEKSEINENTILIGHSCGSAFLVRWLGETKRKINKLILVAPWKIPDPDNSDPRKVLYDYIINPDIKKYVQNIIIFTSDNEEKNGKKSVDMFRKALGGQIIELKKRGHYTLNDMGTEEFPELLEEILKDNTKTPKQSSEVFSGSESNPRCKIQTCHSIGIIDDNKNFVKSQSSAEPAEGLEPSDHKMTSLDPHHTTGKSAPSLLYQNNKAHVKEKAYTGDGININSNFLNGLKTGEAKKKIINWLSKNNLGKKAINYKLRDWIFSRQHYWGEPIPIIKCGRCGNVPLSEKDLPLKLPDVKKYEPTDTGESPLANITEWVNIKCPICKNNAKRETDTMPNWAGSSWYYLAYIMQGISNFQFPISNYKKAFDYWMPVDLYNGGMEHTTLHLLYSRFWYKFLYDLGYVNTPEPYKMRRSHGVILAEDGQKMSKSRGNVINPDEIIEKYGADTLRLYEMFMGPYSEAIPWNTSSLIGMSRFLERIWGLNQKSKIKNQNDKSKFKDNTSQKTGNGLERLLHITIKKVTEDIENLKFNTAISQLMILTNEMEKQKKIPITNYQLLITLLSPFAPHIAEELWEMLGNKESIHLQKWPKYDKESAKEKEIELVIQINGKVRDRIKASADISEEEAKKIAFESEKVKKWIEGKVIRKIIFVKGRLINIVFQQKNAFSIIERT